MVCQKNYEIHRQTQWLGTFLFSQKFIGRNQGILPEWRVNWVNARSYRMQICEVLIPNFCVHLPVHCLFYQIPESHFHGEKEKYTFKMELQGFCETEFCRTRSQNSFLFSYLAQPLRRFTQDILLLISPPTIYWPFSLNNQSKQKT